MSLRMENGKIVADGPRGTLYPDADQIYGAVFEEQAFIEGVSISPEHLRNLGLHFSNYPATPVVVLSAGSSELGEPLVRCALAGRVGKITVNATPDYVVIDEGWYPLPQGAWEEFIRLTTDAGISDIDSLTLGQYLRVLRSDTDFFIEDLAAEQVAAGALAATIPMRPIHGIKATLYPYQETGLQWLGFMARQELGAILADEMGLGKTLQVIAVLLWETQSKRRPNLVLCPATLLENWRREIERFAPALKVHIHAGPMRPGSVAELGNADVTVASYETMGGDISLFRAVSWNLIALDEAQSIKNPDARRTLRAKELPKRVGIAITGTPIENRLTDLWSISDFVIPGHLGTRSNFEKRFPNNEDGARDVEALVSPIMLRRRVQEVASDLPERIDIPVPLIMDTRSIVAYEEIRKDALAATPQAPDLAALIHLRMFCAHPWAAAKMTDIRPAVDCSSKMKRCFEILDEICETNTKAIIFTSFNDVADLLADDISSTFSVPTWKINGSVAVATRQEIIDKFSAVEGAAILVLNPKAAGVGLNITAANHVIHYNLEWNPAVEDQASARSYRRGQTLPVTVHRLFYVDTVEEVINERLARKRALAEHAVIGTTGEANDLADILQAIHRSPDL